APSSRIQMFSACTPGLPMVTRFDCQPQTPVALKERDCGEPPSTPIYTESSPPLAPQQRTQKLNAPEFVKRARYVNRGLFDCVMNLTWAPVLEFACMANCQKIPACVVVTCHECPAAALFVSKCSHSITIIPPVSGIAPDANNGTINKAVLPTARPS